ncbi:MAG: hypothetical protein FJZ59_07215 [Chlamydiae bacterium]|nr:hypothetical protein [Chlamydiota bacterium]
MRLITTFSLLSLLLSPLLEARGGHGGGHGGGGHRESNHDGSRQVRGGRGYHDHGNWRNHSRNYNHGDWNGRQWNGPYYYNGFGWWAGGAFLVGFTFYTCTNAAIANTHTWQIYNGDVNVYNNWPDQENITVEQVDNDSDYPYRLSNGTSCVRAKAAQT